MNKVLKLYNMASVMLETSVLSVLYIFQGIELTSRIDRMVNT